MDGAPSGQAEIENPSGAPRELNRGPLYNKTLSGLRARPGPTRKAAKAEPYHGIRRILTRKSREGQMKNYIPFHM
eukprot:5360112-Prymnesium_polylepis.1